MCVVWCTARVRVLRGSHVIVECKQTKPVPCYIWEHTLSGSSSHTTHTHAHIHTTLYGSRMITFTRHMLPKMRSWTRSSGVHAALLTSASAIVHVGVNDFDTAPSWAFVEGQTGSARTRIQQPIFCLSVCCATFEDFRVADRRGGNGKRCARVHN